jgi:ClpP class serine protease
MTDQPEALRLADELGGVSDALADEAAAELRRLHHENERLKAEVLMERAACADICDQHASVEGIAQRCAEQIRARSKT